MKGLTMPKDDATLSAASVGSPVPFTPYYERDGITIYNADCRKVLPFLERFDLLLTDPPYGIGIAKRGTIGTSKAAAVRDYGRSDWDNSTPPSWFMQAAQLAAETNIIWGGNYYGLPGSSCWLVWDKDNTGDFADCELAWTNMERAVRKFRWRWNGMLQENGGAKKEQRFHPTQKPLALMRWCLSLVPDAATVLDPFMGSGTTLVAAKLEGRQAVGIEISEKYCEAAANRLSQGTLF
jgi:DNA modification methylase